MQYSVIAFQTAFQTVHNQAMIEMLQNAKQLMTADNNIALPADLEGVSDATMSTLNTSVAITHADKSIPKTAFPLATENDGAAEQKTSITACVSPNPCILQHIFLNSSGV